MVVFINNRQSSFSFSGQDNQVSTSSSCVSLAKPNPVYASQSSAGLDILNEKKGGVE